jgi:hypothetical protein
MTLRADSPNALLYKYRRSFVVNLTNIQTLRQCTDIQFVPSGRGLPDEYQLACAVKNIYRTSLRNGPHQITGKFYGPKKGRTMRPS